MATFRVFMRPWSIFFLLVTVTIVVTMMVPAAFGLQNVTQWGGMYTDAWCSVHLYDGDPYGDPVPASEQIWAGRIGTVWSVPMFNQAMCLVWARKFCGNKSPGGLAVRWVDPIYKGKKYFEPKNPCALDLPPSYDWFQYAP